MTVTNIAGADEAERAMVRKPHVAQEEEEKEKEANEEQAVVQPIAELLVAMEQAAVELEAAATEQPAVEQLEVEQAVAEQPVPRVRLVMKPREEATTRGGSRGTGSGGATYEQTGAAASASRGD